MLLRLRALEGVGDAVIEYVAMRALNHSDALPPDLADLPFRAEAWKPWRAYAAMLLMCSGPTAARRAAISVRPSLGAL